MSETVRLNLQEMVERFRFLGDKLAPTIYTAMLVSAQKMLRDGVMKHMSNPSGPRNNYAGSGPGQLGRDSGQARKTMSGLAGLDAERIFALFGSHLDYVKAHEEGFHGTQHVRAHTRRLVRLSRNTKTGLISRKSAREYKRAIRSGQKITAMVRPHGRKVDILAKHFIRDTVLEAVPPTEQRIMRALMLAAKTGKVPTPGQVGA